MKRTSTVALLLLTLLVSGLVATACGGSSTADTPTPVGATGNAAGGDTPTAAAGAGAAASNTPRPVPGATTAKVGAAVELGDLSVTLTSAKIDSGDLKVAFSFDNSNGADSGVIRLTSFTAVAPDGSNLDPDIVCSTLPSTVGAGKKVDGLLCWNAAGAASATGYKISYDAGRAVGKTITWVLP